MKFLLLSGPVIGRTAAHSNWLFKYDFRDQQVAGSVKCLAQVGWVVKFLY
jgi:hypothetical protein